MTDNKLAKAILTGAIIAFIVFVCVRVWYETTIDYTPGDDSCVVSSNNSGDSVNSDTE